MKLRMLLAVAGLAAAGLGGDAVRVSGRHPRYFELEGGKTWIPVGCNICFDRKYDGAAHGDKEVRENFGRWMRAFASNGGNCMRVWLGHASLEVEPKRPGEFDGEKTETLRGIVKLAEELGIRIKFTMESFRGMTFDPKAKPSIFKREAYCGVAKDFREFFGKEECREIYLNRARHFKAQGFGDSPAVYCWELWNEINSTSGIETYAGWSEYMLAELKKMFPRQMTVQNLGSFDGVGATFAYDQMAGVKGNDFMQVHRYLDAGADFDECRGPMDEVAASATREMLRRRVDCPAIVAEVGAVKALHTGPFAYYGQDKEGALLHDEIFAPFFSGSAGCGQPWHWDHQYIDGNGLWWQFGRFARAVEGLDPVAEGFEPFYTETRRLRIYGLRGKETVVMWCRDKRNGWVEEFVEGEKPELVAGERLGWWGDRLECYDPWADRRVVAEDGVLPAFRRSIVVRVKGRLRRGEESTASR